MMNCFDIHLDEKKKAWFIEANGNPGLKTASYSYSHNKNDFTGLESFKGLIRTLVSISDH